MLRRRVRRARSHLRPGNYGSSPSHATSGDFARPVSGLLQVRKTCPQSAPGEALFSACTSGGGGLGTSWHFAMIQPGDGIPDRLGHFLSPPF